MSGGNQQGANDDMIIWALAAAILAGIAFVVWWFFSTEILSALRWVRVWEMHAAELVAGADYSVTHPTAGRMELGQWKSWLPTADPDGITGDYIKVMSELALYPLRYIFAFFLGLMAIWSIFKGPGTYYRRQMNLDGLMLEQSRMFPFIKPFLKFNPNKLPGRSPGDPVPKNLPMFAEALAPEEWVAHHGIRFEGGKLDYPAAYRALSKQLGPRWQGPGRLPIHQQGLYAAFALRSVRKRKESERLLETMAACWSADKGFRPTPQLKKVIRNTLRDPKVCRDLNRVSKKHAYVTTALLRALQRAREEGGVSAPAQFVWLRGFDRSLWYPLNNLGRRSYHAEAAGALAHYTNELIADQKIPSPRFEEVIKVFEKTLTGPDARRVPERI